MAVDWTQQLSLEGAYYLPTCPSDWRVLAQWQLQAELNIFTAGNWVCLGETALRINYGFHQADEHFTDTASVKLYRTWLKAGNTQSEFRLGLQRLNFGSATLIRPLQWFDNLRPNDPQEQTEGVQAALFRYFWLNNANLWLWAIRNDGQSRGFTLVSGSQGSAGMGGRWQIPVLKGEAGISYHHNLQTEMLNIQQGAEDKLGLDYRTSGWLGFWLEGAANHLSSPLNLPAWQVSLTQGLDWSLPLGNSLHALMENNVYLTAEQAVDTLSPRTWQTAFSLDYPLGLLDALFLYDVFDYEGDNHLASVIWRRTYDRLSWDASLFWNSGGSHALTKDRGAQLSINYTF